MTHKRNTDGLAKAARIRRQETIQRVSSAIKSLEKNGKTINFNSVSKQSGVGKTWLYKEKEVRERISKIRQNTAPIKKISDNFNSESKDAVIKMLKNHIKEMEGENKELKKQIEFLYGEMHLNSR